MDDLSSILTEINSYEIKAVQEVSAKRLKCDSPHELTNNCCRDLWPVEVTWKGSETNALPKQYIRGMMDWFYCSSPSIKHKHMIWSVCLSVWQLYAAFSSSRHFFRLIWRCSWRWSVNSWIVWFLWPAEGDGGRLWLSKLSIQTHKNRPQQSAQVA